MLLELLVAVFLLAAGVLLLIAAWGVVALPDALARQHAATLGLAALTLLISLNPQPLIEYAQAAALSLGAR